MPVTRQLDRRFLPIWNTSVLREEWSVLLQKERRRARGDFKAFSRKEIAEERKSLEARSLAGPLSRLLVAEAANTSVVAIRKLAKERGFWVREILDEYGHTPFQALMFRLFVDKGHAPLWFDFDDEVAADMAAQKRVDQIRARRNNPPVVPEQIKIWKVLSEPFLAVEKSYGLSWWVECQCAAPGCRNKSSQWKPIEALKRSKASHCKRHSQPPNGSLLSRLETLGDDFQSVVQRHVPDLFRGLDEIRHPDMAQGALEKFNVMLANPPSRLTPKPSKIAPLLSDWSQIFPPAPYDDSLPLEERDDLADF